MTNTPTPLPAGVLATNGYFMVGDEVSYGFNGDWYPDGKIVRISKTGKVITTDSGRRYYRTPRDSYKSHKTWTLTKGHISEQNPHF